MAFFREARPVRFLTLSRTAAMSPETGQQRPLAFRQQHDGFAAKLLKAPVFQGFRLLCKQPARLVSLLSACAEKSSNTAALDTRSSSINTAQECAGWAVPSNSLTGHPSPLMESAMPVAHHAVPRIYAKRIEKIFSKLNVVDKT